MSTKRQWSWALYRGIRGVKVDGGGGGVERREEESHAGKQTKEMLVHCGDTDTPQHATP